LVIDEEVERSLVCAFPRSYTTYLLVLYLAFQLFETYQ
jgi:hypothetical protein